MAGVYMKSGADTRRVMCLARERCRPLLALERQA